MIKKLVKNDIAVYSMHTNYDIAQGGLNDYLCELLNLKEITVLAPTDSRTFCKVIIYVPTTHLEVIREAIIRYNECTIGTIKVVHLVVKAKAVLCPLKVVSLSLEH